MMNKFLDAVKFFFTQYPDNENEVLIKDKSISLY